MKSLGVFLILLIAVACWQFRQTNDSIAEIREELFKDRNRLMEHKAMLEEMRAYPVKTPGGEEKRRLEQERRDLIRLRGELTRLSSTKNQTLEELDHEIASTKAQAEALVREAHLISDMEKAREQRVRDRNVMHSIHHLWTYYGKQQQKTPGSLEEVIHWIKSLPGEPVEKSMAENVSVGSTFRSATWKDFELLDTGRSDSEGDPLIVLREKEPRTMPDDSVSRFYILQSGQFKEIHASSQEFQEKEVAFLFDVVK